jgi:hypothetical protein
VAYQEVDGLQAGDEIVVTPLATPVEGQEVVDADNLPDGYLDTGGGGRGGGPPGRGKGPPSKGEGPSGNTKGSSQNAKGPASDGKGLPTSRGNQSKVQGGSR